MYLAEEDVDFNKNIYNPAAAATKEKVTAKIQLIRLSAKKQNTELLFPH